MREEDLNKVTALLRRKDTLTLHINNIKNKKHVISNPQLDIKRESSANFTTVEIDLKVREDLTKVLVLSLYAELKKVIAALKALGVTLNFKDGKDNGNS